MPTIHPAGADRGSRNGGLSQWPLGFSLISAAEQGSLLGQLEIAFSIARQAGQGADPILLGAQPFGNPSLMADGLSFIEAHGYHIRAFGKFDRRAR